MNTKEAHVLSVLCEVCCDNAFKLFADVAEENGGSVAGGLFWTFAQFMDHCNYY